MDKDQNLMDHQAVSEASTPPVHPGVKLTPVGNPPPNTGVYTAGVIPQDGNPSQQPNPVFKPIISEQSNPGVVFTDPGYVANLADLGEDDDMKAFDFTNRSIRKSFIRKVYSILMAQLLVTMAVIAWFLFHEPTKRWLHGHVRVVYYSFLAPTFAFLLVMVCCEKARRTFPLNFILLSVFTVCMSGMLGTITSLFKTNVVLMAVGISAAVCLALTIFALQTKWDFTVLGGLLCVFLTVLVLFGLLCLVLRTTSPILSSLYACIGALIFSFYLIYDTQMIMGGDHKYGITPEEYIFGALALYLDIINFFIFILRLLRAFS